MVSQDFTNAAFSIGKNWRSCRRSLPSDVLRAYVTLLKTIGPYFQPSVYLSPKDNLANARGEACEIANLLVKLAAGPGKVVPKVFSQAPVAKHAPKVSEERMDGQATLGPPVKLELSSMVGVDQFKVANVAAASYCCSLVRQCSANVACSKAIESKVEASTKHLQDQVVSLRRLVDSQRVQALDTMKGMRDIFFKSQDFAEKQLREKDSVIDELYQKIKVLSESAVVEEPNKCGQNELEQCASDCKVPEGRNGSEQVQESENQRAEILNVIPDMNDGVHFIDPHTPITLGSIVELHGLATRPELNSSRGVVQSFEKLSGRCGVALRGENKSVSVKSTNMRAIPWMYLFAHDLWATGDVDFIEESRQYQLELEEGIVRRSRLCKLRLLSRGHSIADLHLFFQLRALWFAWRMRCQGADVADDAVHQQHVEGCRKFESI